MFDVQKAYKHTEVDEYINKTLKIDFTLKSPWVKYRYWVLALRNGPGS